MYVYTRYTHKYINNSVGLAQFYFRVWSAIFVLIEHCSPLPIRTVFGTS